MFGVMARTARETLNELRWGGSNRLGDAIVFYRDRTRSEGFRTIRGSEIVDLERRYFTVRTGRLPYYKIQRIEYEGEVVFDR